MCRFFGVLVLGVAMLSVPVRAGADDVVWFDGSDAGMNAAIDAARSTLDLFLGRAVSADGAVHPGAIVKVGLPGTVDGRSGVEHIWVMPFRLDGSGGFTGELLNAPVNLGPMQAGDTVRFGVDQISDWGFFGPEGLLYGGYTLREMIARDPDLAAQLPPMSGSPVPAQW